MSHRDMFDVKPDINAMTYHHPVSVVMKRTCVSINLRKITVVSSTVHEIFIESGSPRPRASTCVTNRVRVLQG